MPYESTPGKITIVIESSTMSTKELELAAHEAIYEWAENAAIFIVPSDE